MEDKTSCRCSEQIFFIFNERMTSGDTLKKTAGNLIFPSSQNQCMQKSHVSRQGT